ncbi:MAG: hypothetical protein ABSA16_10025 [Thermoguttaceae bacterium]|jgi:hypothetical protein
MVSPIEKQLRHLIDAKHAQAIQALKTMTSYLEETLPDGKKLKNPPKKRSPREGTGKIRNKVLAAFGEKFASIQEVADQTKLKRGQVRGVVSAPALQSRFLKKEINGVMHYKYEAQ